MMEARTRLGWIRLYEELGNAGVVCRRCGISRPTLRKWWRRYRAEGESGLESRSRRPHHSPKRKVFGHEEELILALRRERRLGVKRLRIELIREHGLRLALDTIHKVLVRHGERHLKRRLLRRKGSKRYSRPVPGDRVQIDVCKIGPGLYQYTAVDDCSRFQVLGLYPRRTAGNTLAFLEQVLEEMPFAIQRIQTDRGQEFFAYKVQEKLQAWHPADPASLIPSQRQGRACPTHRPGGVLDHRRPERLEPRRRAGRAADLLQLAASTFRPQWQSADRPHL
jgi:transposase-like protein